MFSKSSPVNTHVFTPILAKATGFSKSDFRAGSGVFNQRKMALSVVSENAFYHFLLRDTNKFNWL